MAQSFEQLKSEYADLWQRMEVRPDRASAVNQIANRLIGSKPRYQEVARTSGVPWFVIAALHNRESDANFNTYLGNGEPLNRVTRLVPRGRGPFATWEAGAIDALQIDGLERVRDWSPERACYEIEKFNGFGYRNNHPEVKSPYLWSFSNHYSSGKYVADGHFSSSAVDQQCGAMPIIKRIMELDPSARFSGSEVMVPTRETGPLSMGSRGERVRQLQGALQQQGYAVGELDGIYGTITQAAVLAFQRDANLAQTGIADDRTLQALALASTGRDIPEGASPIRPDVILRILLDALLGRPLGSGSVPSTTSPADSTPANILKQILQKLIPAAPSAPGTNATSMTAPPVILSPIDKMLGGQSLVGKKTMLSIIAFAIQLILQFSGVPGIGIGTTAGNIITTLIGAFGGLGMTSKVDRVVQLLGIMANRASSQSPPAR